MTLNPEIMEQTVSQVQAMLSVAQTQSVESGCSIRTALLQLTDVLKKPPETSAPQFQVIIEMIDHVLRDLKDIREEIADIKRHISRLRLSSYVSTCAPQGHVDLTPCLDPQPIASTLQPSAGQPAPPFQPSEIESSPDEFFRSFS